MPLYQICNFPVPGKIANITSYIIVLTFMNFVVDSMNAFVVYERLCGDMFLCERWKGDMIKEKYIYIGSVEQNVITLRLSCHCFTYSPWMTAAIPECFASPQTFAACGDSDCAASIFTLLLNIQ